MIRGMSLWVGFVFLGLGDIGIAAPHEGDRLFLEARKYSQGNGCPIDEKRAKALYLKAADLGEPKACALRACWIYFGMRGFEKNESYAKREFQALLNSLSNLRNAGDEDASLFLAFGNLVSEQYQGEGITQLRELALSGKPEACLLMSWAYARGMGTSSSMEESYGWAKQAAEKGNVEGMLAAGKKLFEGKGVAKDVAAGLDWLKRAAEKGLPEAQNELGNLYCHGRGVLEDALLSTQWLSRAAEQELAEAEFHLARHYLDGRGVAPDSAEAEKWIRLAIAHGQKNTDELLSKIQTARTEESESLMDTEDPSAKSKEQRVWRVAGPFDVPPGSAKDFFSSFGWKEFPATMGVENRVTLMAMTREVKKVQTQSQSLSLDKILGPRTNCFAVARLEMDAGPGGCRVISIGSDDAIKIWLNGKEIHQDWVARSVRPGEDLILADFNPGKNDLAVMIQNFGGPWGMNVEVPDAKGLNRILAQSVMQGDTERVATLLAGGGDPNGECISKVFNHTETACFMGRERLHRLLLEKGGRDRWYHPAWYPRVASFLLQWAGRLDHRSTPGVSILMTRHGKPLLEVCVGMSNIETGSKITPETRFPIGSISKHFISAALLRLQEEGKLQLTNPISLYFPSFPRGEKIKVRQLLDHSSGIYNYTSRSDFSQKCRSSAAGSEILRYISEWPFGDFPGRRFEYSNSNYYLAGLIVEKVAGQSLATHLQKRFFQPLGMEHTTLGDGDVVIPQMASAYTGNDKKVKRCETWNMNWAGGAGGIVSTPRDMNLWMEALHEGSVLKPESILEMVRVETNAYSSFTKSAEGYACGLLVEKGRGGKTFISHTGYLPPYRASMVRVKDWGVNVIVMGNGDCGFQALNPDWLQAGMLALFFRDEMGPSTRDHEPAVYPKSEIERLSGTYDDGRNLFYLQNNGSRWILDGNKSREFLRSIGPDEWVCKDCGRMLTAVRNSALEVVGLQINDGSLMTLAMKRRAWDPEGVEAMRRLTDYPGKYDFGGTWGTLNLTIEKGKLAGEWSTGSRALFESLGQDEFVAPGRGIRLTFERDAIGSIRRLIAQNEGYTWELVKQGPPEVSDGVPVPEVIR